MRSNWNPTRKKIFFVLVIILSLGAILQIWVVNRMSTFGEQITRIEFLKSDLKMENQLMENMIAQNASLEKIKIYAKNLGLTNVKKVVYINPTKTSELSSEKN